MTCIVVVIENFIITSFNIVNLNYIFEINILDDKILNIVIDFELYIIVFNVFIFKVIVIINIISFIETS